MNDGNKESVKELLGAFRIVASADLSILLGVVAINSRRDDFRPSFGYVASLALLIASLSACIYLFLLCISKIAKEDEAIIDQRPVKLTAAAALLMLLLATVLLVLCMLA